MAYLKHTDTSSERFKELSARDSRTQQELSRGTERIKRLEAELLRLRAKMAANARDFSARNAQLTQERDGMAKHVVSLKGRVQRSRQRAASKMQTLSLAAKDTKADLADRTALAERVLKLAERCRGLETQKEKNISLRHGQQRGGGQQRRGGKGHGGGPQGGCGRGGRGRCHWAEEEGGRTAGHHGD